MKRGYLYGGIATLLAAGLLYTRSCKDGKIDQQTQSPVLAPTDSAKIILDERKHTITTVTRTGPIKETFLPPHITAITVGNDGKVTVHARQWGTEIDPFIGVALGSDIRGRAALGVNLFYVQRWELGGGLMLGSDVRDTRVMAHLSYSLYGSSFVSVGFDHKQTAHLIVGLKF